MRGEGLEHKALDSLSGTIVIKAGVQPAHKARGLVAATTQTRAKAGESDPEARAKSRAYHMGLAQHSKTLSLAVGGQA